MVGERLEMRLLWWKKFVMGVVVDACDLEKKEGKEN